MCRMWPTHLPLEIENKILEEAIKGDMALFPNDSFNPTGMQFGQACIKLYASIQDNQHMKARAKSTFYQDRIMNDRLLLVPGPDRDLVMFAIDPDNHQLTQHLRLVIQIDPSSATDSEAMEPRWFWAFLLKFHYGAFPQLKSLHLVYYYHGKARELHPVKRGDLHQLVGEMASVIYSGLPHLGSVSVTYEEGDERYQPSQNVHSKKKANFAGLGRLLARNRGWSLLAAYEGLLQNAKELVEGPGQRWTFVPGFDGQAS